MQSKDQKAIINGYALEKQKEIDPIEKPDITEEKEIDPIEKPDITEEKIDVVV